MLSWIKNIFRQGTSGFRAYERAVLDAVAHELPVDAEHRLQERIRAVNLVQRIDGGREVNCYVMQHGQPVLNDSTRIDDSQGERSLATFRVDGPLGTTNKGEVWLVDGNFFSIEFDDATEHANAEAISSIQVTTASRLENGAVSGS